MTDAEVSLVVIAVTMTTDMKKLPCSFPYTLPDYLSVLIISSEVPIETAH